jgi:membrane associated rhomboid family serine protease
VRVLFIFFIFVQVIRIPAYLVLLWWVGYQVLLGLPELSRLEHEVSAGVAVWAHIGGFAAGALLVKLFARGDYVAQHRAMMAHRHRFSWR